MAYQNNILTLQQEKILRGAGGTAVPSYSLPVSRPPTSDQSHHNCLDPKALTGQK